MHYPVNHILDAHVVTPSKTTFLFEENRRMIRSCDFTNTATRIKNPPLKGGKSARKKGRETGQHMKKEGDSRSLRGFGGPNIGAEKFSFYCSAGMFI
jgi:hypothetical protein